MKNKFHPYNTLPKKTAIGLYLDIEKGKKNKKAGRDFDTEKIEPQ